MSSLKVATLFLLLAVAATFIDANPQRRVSPRSKSRLFRGRPWHGLVPKPDLDEKDLAKTVGHDYFTQKVTHFDANNIATYQQQYWWNDQWYKPGGPQFLMIGGEAGESDGWVRREDLEWIKIAKQNNAQVFILEHRYYGKSQPVPDMSTANMQYLSSEEAIEDIATFIQGMNTKFNLTAPVWITFGGSYSGALSAWARQAHPELIAGAVGSSGPVLAEVDFVEYLEVVQNSLTTYSAQCAQSLKNGLAQIATLMQTDSGRSQLNSKFRLCYSLDINKPLDITTFWDSVIGNYMGVVQYSEDNVSVYKSQLNIPVICRFHTDNNGKQDIDKIVDVNNYLMGFYGESCLYTSYQGTVQFFQDTNFNSQSSDDRSWIYQTCTEFGYYQSTDSQTAGPFYGAVVPIQYYTQQCADIYGSQFTNSSIYAAVAKTNANYGDRTNYNGTNVVLPNGTVDPWHALGILNNIGQTVTAIVIDGTAHCADMYPASTTDKPGLAPARAAIELQVSSWVTHARQAQKI